MIFHTLTTILEGVFMIGNEKEGLGTTTPEPQAAINDNAETETKTETKAQTEIEQAKQNEGTAGTEENAGSDNIPQWVKNQLPPRFHAEEALYQYAKPADVVDAFLELKERVDNSVLVPKDITKATPETRETLRKSLGVPDDPSGYEIKQEWLAKIAWEVGVPKAQLRKLLDKQTEVLTEFAQQQAKETVSKLEKEWGADYQKNIALAKKGAEYLFSKVDDSIFNNYDTVMAMHKVGKLISNEPETPVATKSHAVNTTSIEYLRKKFKLAQ